MGKQCWILVLASLCVLPQFLSASSEDYEKRECGRSPDPIPKANAEQSSLDTWPWMAYIEYDGYFICGASIIGDYIIITAAHCVVNVTDKKLIRIATGTNYLYLDLPHNRKVLYSVVEVRVHPTYNPRLDNSLHDFALLVVDRRIKFNDKTQPLCLPALKDIFSITNDCFMAGWGQISCNEKKLVVNQLRQQKVTFDWKRCNTSELLNGTLRDYEMCAPFLNGVVEVGVGDTGNPVFCNDKFGIFKLVGVTSPVKKKCMETTFITFPSIKAYFAWMHYTTMAVFTCDNGHVLVHQHHMCNNFDDCGDNSDEVRGCGDISRNECIRAGYVEHRNCDSYFTPLPSRYFNCRDMECLYTVFDRISSEGKYPDSSFLCNLVFPRCQSGVVKLHSKQYCKDGLSLWGRTIFYDQVCNLLPDKGFIKKLPVPHVMAKPRCSKHNYLYCTDVGNGYVDVKILAEQKSKVTPMVRLKDYINKCSDTAAKFYFCGVQWPHCEEGYEDRTYPCLDYCDDLKKSCPSLMKYEDCEQRYNELRDHACVDPTSRQNFSLKRTTKARKEAANPRKSYRRVFCPFPGYIKTCGSCQTLSHDLCSELGFKQTYFPNYGAGNESEANKKFDLMRPAILSGCHPKVLLFFCGLYFPVCEDAGVTMSCKDLCQEITSKCVLPKEVMCDTLRSKDEASCLSTNPQIVCDPEVKFKCDNGMCIPKSLSCDGAYDCPDKSDEKEPCDCKPDQIKCLNSSACYMDQWICDGEKDCPGGEDEADCNPCAVNGGWTCVNGNCVSDIKRCDGHIDCSDFSDEIDCISSSGAGNSLLVNTAGNDKLQVCFEGFSNKDAETACRWQGKNNATSFKHYIDTSNTLKKLLLCRKGSTMTTLGSGTIVDSCPENKLAVLECLPAMCGSSKIAVPPANIESSIHGTWPWVAYITLDKTFQCGATLINELYLLTSAQCVWHLLDRLKRVQIATGSKYLSPISSKNNVQPNKQFHNVEKIIIHPKFKASEANTEHDIALVLATEPIKYNEETQPVCTPTISDVFTRANDCFLAGWGQSLCNLKKDQLRQRKLTLWDESKCNGTFLLNGTLRPHEACAQFYNGFVATGKRDGGSPILCRDVFGTFKIVGMAPAVTADCMETTIITFPAIQHYIDWIKEQMVFVCDNRRVLAHESQLCNNIDDCGDNSDEIKPCETKISLNCSFDDNFLCGYQVYGSDKDFLSTSLSDREVNLHPLFDHTQGKHPGRWIPLFKGRYQRNPTMKSPMVILKEAHCVRFHYHMRGVIETGAAIYHFDGSKMVSKFDLRKKKGMDRWLMGMFDVDPGPFQMFIRAYQDVFSVDDIFVLPGSCAAQKCLKGEFQCYVGSQRSCLPEAARCNIVKDCKYAEDEDGCNYMARKLECTFDNGNLCGFRQSDADDGVKEWVMTVKRKADTLPDETNLEHVSGSIFRLITLALSIHKKITMTQVLELKNVRHCLRFFYLSRTSAHLTVYLKFKDEILVLRKIALYKYRIQWRTLFVDLPSGMDQAVLYYEVNMMPNFIGYSELLIDYVTITPHACACPKHTVKCVDEDKCLPKSQVCDGKKDCETNSDELNCPCKNADEIKCKSGQCVSSQKACNRVKDCKDGDDEGKMCDSKRSVSCSFEDDFLCGYILGSSSTFRIWREVYSKGTEAPVSHGSSNHTNTHRLVLEGNKNSRSRLASIPFDARNKSLRLSFILYNRQANERNNGSLVVSGFIPKKKTILKKFTWSTYATIDRTWKTECVTLPHVENMQLLFQTIHPRYGSMRLEIDDVILSSGGCE